MSNFSLPIDPLLYGGQPPVQQPQIDYKQKAYEMRNTDYKPYTSDYTGELDRRLSNLSEDEASMLSEDGEYQVLAKELNAYIQSEMLLLIKNRINSNPNAVKNIERQISIIENIKSEIKHQERENMQELNDYIKNYSNLTFDEYKKKKAKNK